jgi:hypothetical protein
MKTKIAAFALAVLSIMACSRPADAQFGGPVGGAFDWPGYGFGYGYGLMGAGSTAAGSFLLGSAAQTAAMGEAELLDSMASKNYQEAYQSWMENQKLREATYFDMRRMHASYRAEAHVSAPTPEQLLAISHSRLPQRMTDEQLDRMSGQIRWPDVLDRDEFASSRAAVEHLFAERAARPYSAGRGTRNFREIHRVTDEMHDALRTLLGTITADEFIAGNKFLNSIAYEARFAPDSTTAAN